MLNMPCSVPKPSSECGAELGGDVLSQGRERTVQGLESELLLFPVTSAASCMSSKKCFPPLSASSVPVAYTVNFLSHFSIWPKFFLDPGGFQVERKKCCHLKMSEMFLYSGFIRPVFNSDCWSSCQRNVKLKKAESLFLSLGAYFATNQ